MKALREGAEHLASARRLFEAARSEVRIEDADTVSHLAAKVQAIRLEVAHLLEAEDVGAKLPGSYRDPLDGR